jgi:hypothetical protein
MSSDFNICIDNNNLISKTLKNEAKMSQDNTMVKIEVDAKKYEFNEMVCTIIAACCHVGIALDFQTPNALYITNAPSEEDIDSVVSFLKNNGFEDVLVVK